MHTLNLSGNNKSERYAELLPQIAALIAGETDLTANLANTAAVLKEAFSWLWVGFYLVRDNDLVLGPFQGPLACTRIAYGRGVCGQAWQQRATLVVADVNAQSRPHRLLLALAVGNRRPAYQPSRQSVGRA